MLDGEQLFGSQRTVRKIVSRISLVSTTHVRSSKAVSHFNGFCSLSSVKTSADLVRHQTCFVKIHPPPSLHPCKERSSPCAKSSRYVLLIVSLRVCSSIICFFGVSDMCLCVCERVFVHREWNTNRTHSSRQNCIRAKF
jgi:hypothetical protein